MAGDAAFGYRREHFSAGRIDDSEALRAFFGDEQARLLRIGHSTAQCNGTTVTGRNGWFSTATSERYQPNISHRGSASDSGMTGPWVVGADAPASGLRDP